MKKKLISILALLTVTALLLAGCAAHGKTLMEAGNESISVNVFQLYLSRMRYSLKLTGDSVDGKGYWDIIVDTDNTTQGEYYTNQVFEGLKQIAAAMILYDELGLKLPKETEDQIDELIDQMIEEVGGGSKSRFNSVLSAYGANVTALRDSYIIEAKIEQLKDELYGKDCDKVAATAKEQFYKEMYYRGKQFCLFNQYHAHDKDEYGQSIYYEKNADGSLKTGLDGKPIILYQSSDSETVKVERFEEVNKDGNTVVVYRKQGGIAYDKENGMPSDDAKRDAAGDLIYYNKDGSIAYIKDGTWIRAVEEKDADGNTVTVYRHMVPAYDEVNGARQFYYEKDGSEKMATYTDDEWAKIYLDAVEFAKTCAEADNGEATFDEFSKKYNQNTLNENVAPNGMYFLTGSAVTQAGFSDFAKNLSEMKVGETRVLTVAPDGSAKAYYVIMRCELNDGAWSDAQNKTWFESFFDVLREYLLQKKVIDGGYVEQVVVDEAVKKSVDISMVATNNFY